MPELPNRAELQRLYRSLYRIRRVEESIAEVYPSDCIQSPVHLSLGQEAVSVGVCDCLSPGDVTYGTYRGHALYLARGGDLSAMFAELYGRDGGCARGKGGSMHLIDRDHGVMGTSAIVASTIPLAVGHALAFAMNGARQIAVSFFGDGATEEGVWHESLNFASVRALPILFVCENNGLAISSPLTARQPPGTSITERAAGYGIPSVKVSGGDVLEVRRQAQLAVDAIRNGKGPRFIECSTTRWSEHVGPRESRDRPDSSAEDNRSDALSLLGRLIAPGDARTIRSEVEADIEAAIRFASNSPYPKPAGLHQDVT